ncbi:hypothetical protein CR205_04755 [Alteribacter lacisalsi]|uniref:tRNA(Met) cytidine acetate ligase n=1 Tax=Alteribacter lacisalsi TaxID=2045244 RepID=A0A2W0HM17_9BACI|nr:nucleotidyltransferase [Alteribacter lacisalsi]PYZ97909.1 hypothetical protein CR205_04755 [Alteribacter lacisalsi]
MKTTGLVVEYNPFHNGHQYHLTESKQKTGAEIVIAVMSGSFLQRGEPALTDKWTRTKMALMGGCDLVVELPFAYAVQHASIFARGAVALLDKLGAQSVVFGSEDGNIERFKDTNRLLKEKKEEFDHFVQEGLQEGFSYPRASSYAYSRVAPGNFEGVDLSEPNNILGLQYCEAAEELGGRITPMTITREQSGYHDTTLGTGSIASATGIRRTLFSDDANPEDIRPFVPLSTYTCLQEYKERRGCFHSWDDYFPFLRHKLITESAHELSSLYEMEEGLEHRFKKALHAARDFETFISYIKTKRYTRTRLQRAMVHMLMNTKKDWYHKEADPLKPEYIRLLGMSDAGQKYLSSIKKKLEIPLVSNASKGTHPLFTKDIEAAAVHSLPFAADQDKEDLLNEYSRTPFRYSKTGGTFL